MECQRTNKQQTAYPIFYDVEPTEVRHQSGAVGEALAKHEKGNWNAFLPLDHLCSIVAYFCNGSSSSSDGSLVDLENEDIARWRSAMKEAAGLAGMELKNTFSGHEAKFIQQLVQEISLKLHFINSITDGKLVGIETRVKSVVSSLESGFHDVRMIGIKGMGGGGKTTLARAIFDLISIWFEGKSFVENVREVSKGSLSGLKELQKQILKDVLNDQSIDLTSVSGGKYMMKKMMCNRKVLIVLDDVDDIDQLEALAGELTWFKPGSRIIITTRDKQVLLAHRVNCIHDVSLLSNEEAFCLFSRHAFGREIPVHGYEELSRKVVHYAAGLPLTIKVLGSHLCNRSEPEWVDTIERLKTIPMDKTLKTLELSYNGLENDQKEIFLDVVCILKGREKDYAIRILKSCGFNAQIGLSVLEQKSLITISFKNHLDFHDHIEEMGKNIVRRLHPNEPRRHSRLWIKEEIEDILANELGTEAKRSIKFGYFNLHPEIIMKGLRKMKELRLLHVNGYASRKVRKVDEGRQYLPYALQSLCWWGYPFRSLPNTFQANKLVNLEMSQSKISKLWEGGERKVLNKLKFLDLSSSNLRTFDLSMTPHLEALNFKSCKNFAELKLPVKCPSLKFLNVSHSKVSNLNLGMTPHLEILDIGYCNHFVELHMPIEYTNLKVINLSGCKVSNLNLGLTPHLERLYLERCSYLQEIHAPVGCLKNLVDFRLNDCLNFEYFMVDKKHRSAVLDSIVTVTINVSCKNVCRLHPRLNLPKFWFDFEYDEPRCSWSGNFEKLLSFCPCICENLMYILATIGDLKHLRKLTLRGGSPWDMRRLESLQKLSLKEQKFQHLPDNICMLKHLKSLKIFKCLLLEQLPENICRLECLENLIIWMCKSLLDIPDNICKMKCLKCLQLGFCDKIKKLPEEFGSLECLKVLDIDGTGIGRLPQSIYQLKGLRIYVSREQLESNGFTSMTELISGAFYRVEL